MLEMGSENCEEFYEVYKGVVPEYLVIYFWLENINATHSSRKSRLCFQQMVRELSSGKFIALEVGANNANRNVYEEFRKFCGPSDPVCFVICILRFFSSFIFLTIPSSTDGGTATVPEIDPREIRCQQSPKCHTLHGPRRRLQPRSGIFF